MTQGRPQSGLPAGPLPGPVAVWVVTAIAVVLGLLLALVIPRILVARGVDCSITGSVSSQACADEQPPQEDLVELDVTP